MDGKNSITTQKKVNTMQEPKPSAVSTAIADSVKTVATKYKTKITILSALVVVFVLALMFTGYKLIARTSGGMTPQSIREISQLATLEFRYRDVISIIEEEEFKLFGLWDIDPGEHILIIQYDGIIKLGIDCGKIKFNEYPASKGGKKRVEIKLPGVELISSETPLNSFEVVVNKGVYTKTTVDMGVFLKEAAKRQGQYNSDTLNGELGKAARENAKKQLQAILESIADVRDNYEIVWVN